MPGGSFESRTCTSGDAVAFGSSGGSFLCEGDSTSNHLGLVGSCVTGVDVNFFQTFLDVPADTPVDAAHPLVMNVTGDEADHNLQLKVPRRLRDCAGPAARAARLYYTVQPEPTSDLSSCIKTGETNRLVIMQIDTCCSGNTLESAYPVYNGVQLTTAKFQPVDCVCTTTVGPCNAACGTNGTQSVTYTISVPANSLGVQCPSANTTQPCTGAACTTAATSTTTPLLTTRPQCTTFAATTADCCAPLQCLRHAPGCNVTASTEWRCAIRAGSSI